MRLRYSFILLVLAAATCLIGSCEDRLTNDPSAGITFSVDTLRFDTVFTTKGSATKVVMAYNRGKEAVMIESVGFSESENFRYNIDGETQKDNLRDILLRGGDSIFMFVKATIDPQDTDKPVLIADSVIFNVNNRRQVLRVEAISQDVIVLRGDTLEGKTELGSDKPYLVFDTVIATGNVLIKEGARFYMHDNAVMVFLGSLIVNGTKDKPVVFRGDRFDNILRDIPYDYASGKWGGIFLLRPSDLMHNPAYSINYLDIHSAMFGLFCQSDKTKDLPIVYLRNSRLHNFSAYGLVLQNMNAEVSNTEISNCADYCVYLAGGRHTFVHNTIANFFNYKRENVSIHSVGREDVAAVYISDLSKNQVRTEAIFKNNIISGWRSQNITLATALPDRYDGVFLGNLLRNDSLNADLFPYNCYEQDEDTVFTRIYFSREEHTYYDFRLDSVSPARNIADSLTAVKYPIDRNGNSRLKDGKPDAGCYEWQPEHTGG
ncbi:MAG: hypothetical protein IJ776_01135 [Paludibacteraceae bacterium]|nr:hypothetical protein [Paludibacteraceae bacterium]